MKSMSSLTLIFALAVLADTVPAAAETLQELAKRTHFHGVSVGRAGTAKLLIASHHGLYAADEKGNVSLVSQVQDFMGFSPDPADPLTYYASGHPPQGGNLGFIRSKDGGANWAQISPGLKGPVDFHQMDVSPADPKTVYGAYGELQVSRDGGESWTAAGAAPPEGLIDLAASSVSADRIYAATRFGLHMSEDAGKTWEVLGFETLPVSLVETGPDGAIYAFVVGRGFLIANENKPDEWTLLSNHFGESIPLHLAVDPQNGQALYVTTQANEILASGDGGASWQPFGAP